MLKVCLFEVCGRYIECAMQAWEHGSVHCGISRALGNHSGVAPVRSSARVSRQGVRSCCCLLSAVASSRFRYFYLCCVSILGVVLLCYGILGVGRIAAGLRYSCIIVVLYVQPRSTLLCCQHLTHGGWVVVWLYCAALRRSKVKHSGKCFLPLLPLCFTPVYVLHCLLKIHC